jgi:group I intron endonuclease
MICYKITNLVTNKSYVGVTTRSIEQRFKEHCLHAIRDQSQYLLHRSMRKHGVENFMIEEVAHALGSTDDLYELEKCLIAQDRTQQPTGYNMTLGGENPPTRSGATPWNKGQQLNQEQKSKQDQSGLQLGRGWNKGQKMNPMREETKSAISQTTKGKPKPEGFAEKIKQSWIKRKAAKEQAAQVLYNLTNKEYSHVREPS